MISCERREHLAHASLLRVEAGAAGIGLVARRSFDQPQTVPASAPTASSERPKTLPTSRTAERVR